MSLGEYYIWPSRKNCAECTTADEDERRRAGCSAVERFFARSDPSFGSKSTVCARSLDEMRKLFSDGDFLYSRASRKTFAKFDACLAAAAIRARDAYARTHPPPEAYLQPWALRLLRAIWTGQDAAASSPAGTPSVPVHAAASALPVVLRTMRPTPTAGAELDCTQAADWMVDAAENAASAVYRCYLPDETRKRALDKYHAARDLFLACQAASRAHS